MTGIMFKVEGTHSLLTYEELMLLQNKSHISKVRVIDLKTQKNWNTNLKTVIAKFR